MINKALNVLPVSCLCNFTNNYNLLCPGFQHIKREGKQQRKLNPFNPRHFGGYHKFQNEAKPITTRKHCTYRLPIHNVIWMFDGSRTARYFGMDHHIDDDDDDAVSSRLQ